MNRLNTTQKLRIQHEGEWFMVGLFYKKTSDSLTIICAFDDDGLALVRELHNEWMSAIWAIGDIVGKFTINRLTQCVQFEPEVTTWELELKEAK